VLHDWLAQIVLYIVLAIQIAGIAIVLWGVLEALQGLLRGAIRGDSAVAPARRHGEIRIRLGGKMVLALEFFIAGDIIQTVMVPSWESLGILAGIVAIRTVIAYFLEYELRMGVHEVDGPKR
jgi:uncharacterized membrane protein